MRLSEFISEGKLTKRGIDLIENYVEEIQEQEKKINELKKSFAYSLTPSFTSDCMSRYSITYHTKQEVQAEIYKAFSMKVDKGKEELIKVNLELNSKISFFNKLTWYKRIFKTI